MTGTTLPLLIAIAGVIVGLLAARSVRQGGARFYALERDLMLRRANFLLLTALLLLGGSVALLVYSSQQRDAQEAAARETATAVARTATTEAPLVQGTQVPFITENVPAIIAPLPTEDPNAPVPTPTPIIRRGIVENTGGSGAYLRERAGTGGRELELLRDGSTVILMDDEPQQANGYTWVKVRTPLGVEGWVADIFLTQVFNP